MKTVKLINNYKYKGQWLGQYTNKKLFWILKTVDFLGIKYMLVGIKGFILFISY